MAKKKKNSNNNFVEEQEVLKVLIISVGLVFAQIILNGLGYGGISMVVTLYALAIFAGRQFVVDRNGVQAREETLSSFEYLIRASIDIGLVLAGLFLWFIAGLWWGLAKTFKGGKTPEDSYKILSQNNVLVKLLFTEISHLTMFAFTHLWVNLYNAAEVAWSGN